MPPRFGRIGDWSNDDKSDENSGDEDDKRETWFAGGERSGLSVQNPNRQRESEAGGGDLVAELLRRAAEGGAAPQEPRPTPGFRVFSGGGHTLGSDEVESTYIADPNAQPEEDEVVTRTITLWKNGFNIEDGDFMSLDDSNNSQIIADLIAGTAPLHLLNVRPGQRVDLRIDDRREEPYRLPPGVRAFRGSGQRLGAPVPQPAASSSMPGSFPASASTNTPSPATQGSNERPRVITQFEVDQSKPTTSVQVRLADGTRLPCRMNMTHTVGDIRNFINASRPENATRPYTIGTTFPNRVLDDDSATIESAGLASSVVVQRWA